MSTNILTMKMEGLDCPNCASKIATKIQKHPDVEQADVNIMTQEAVIQMKNDLKKAELVQEIENIVKSYEPDVVVSEKKEFVQEHHNTHDHTQGQVYGEKAVEKQNRKIIIFAFGIVIYLCSLLFSLPGYTNTFLYLTAYVCFGHNVLFQSLKNIRRKEIFDENFLMAVATIGAISIGQWEEAVGVMLFYNIGESLQDLAINRSRKSIKDLLNIKPEFARVIHNNHSHEVQPEKVQLNDIILVKPGEKIPLDGIVVKGLSQLEMSALTGEFIPKEIHVGDEAVSGSINLTGAIEIRVTKIYSQSTVAKLTEMVEKAAANKAPVELFMTRFAKIYTPIVVGFALLLVFVPSIFFGFDSFQDWLLRGLVFLVISCPCALVVSVPLTFFSGIGAASKKGILVKGSTYIQNLSQVGTMIFDKTGTITKGIFDVKEVLPANGVEEDILIKKAVSLESFSNHPIAVSIVNSFEKVQPENVQSYKEISGYGVEGFVEGKKLIAGNSKMMEKENISITPYQGMGSVVYVAWDKTYLGCIVVSDELKQGVNEMISDLNRKGIQTVMLTGDKKENAEQVAEQVGISTVYAELFPEDKLSILEKYIEDSGKQKIAFVGDGLNDAPSLARADVGIAMGGIGSDAAIEAADVVIMEDNLSKINNALTISDNTNKILYQNITFILFIKFFVMFFGALGMTNMWMAVFADVGVTLLAILNSMRKKAKN